MERFFLSNTLSFLAGSVWLAFVTDVYAPLSLAFEALLRLLNASMSMSIPLRRADTVAVLLFCPAFTVLVFYLEARLINLLAKKAGVEVPVAREAQRGDERRAQKEEERREKRPSIEGGGDKRPSLVMRATKAVLRATKNGKAEEMV